MLKILLTGATDGIGLETAKTFASAGHHVLLHGRNSAKLEKLKTSLAAQGGLVESYVCDMSRLSDVEKFAEAVAERHDSLDVLINNAGVFNLPNPVTPEGLDARFAVNTIAPYLLTQRLLSLLGDSGRIINLSSAAQASVDPAALAGKRRLSAGEAYAQSKLAITMWTRLMARSFENRGGPVVVAVNPGSFLATKMVKEGYGIDGNDVQKGVDILVRAALSKEFASASGKYFDNDQRRFASPHSDALNERKVNEVVQAIDAVLENILP